MQTTLTAIIAGIVIGSSISYYQDAARFCVPILEDAITYQENNVRVAEQLGISCAPEARAEWETNKAKAQHSLPSMDAAAAAAWL